MTATTPRPEPVTIRPYLVRRVPKGSTFLRMLRTTDPKDIGILYLVTCIGFFLIGGAMALLMRGELAVPGQQFLSNEQHSQLFTMHGTIMLLLYATPILFGFANYIVPLQIGAPDVAFPRLNAFSYWLFLFGGLIVLSGFLTPGGAPDFGWTGYAPLSGALHSPGAGADLWIIGLLVAGLGTILGAVNFITTIVCLRGPGMTMFRMPIFTWNIFVTAILILLAFPVLTAALFGLLVDRHLGAHVFDPANGGAILWQHLFWFFGHPEVYIVALPFFGIVTEVFPVFSRKPLFGYKGMVFATMAIAMLSAAVWAHHMFATGAVLLAFFSLTSFLIAVPTGIKFVNWIGTLWHGKLTFETPMLFAVGFAVTFLFGGMTGVLLASPPLNWHVTDTYFVVAHFHYVLFGTIVFATYAGIYFWFPKMTGRMMDETLGKVHFWLTFVGFHGTFLVQHWLGNQGMPRRYADYLPIDGFTALNAISSIFAFVLGASTLPFVWNVFRSYRYGRVVTVDDPWGFGNSLEWATSCPPPRHNFTELPRIRSERPAFELHYPHMVERFREEAHVGGRPVHPAQLPRKSRPTPCNTTSRRIPVRGDMTSAGRVWENEGGRLRRPESTATPSPGPTSVRVRRIYEPVTEQDGIRVLVDRLWPRGMSKSRAEIDEWCRDIAPSTALRRWYAHDPRRFTEFRRRYRVELAAGEQAAALLRLAELAKGRTLTLLTASRDPAISEAMVLAELLEDQAP